MGKRQAVLDLAAEGRSSREIAETLGLSLQCVWNYRSVVGSKPRPAATSATVERIANGSRAAELSAAAHHALGALKVGRIREAIEVLEAVT